MTESQFNLMIYAWIALAVVLVPVQLAVTAPYGRHRSDRWGPRLDNRLGWIIMEAVSPVVLLIAFFSGDGSPPWVVWVMIGLWVTHYVNRSFIFPLRLKTAGKTIPLVIVASAVGFNGVNGWTNGFYLGSSWADYPAEWASDGRFVAGMIVFFIGAAINLHGDSRLLALRQPGGADYVIPRGGLFEWVSCPNHLGEIIEWAGFAILCWNLPALAFAVWTAANLVPRSIAHHRWYRRQFTDYPPERRAIVPFIL